jgi:hypothetical protein
METTEVKKVKGIFDLFLGSYLYTHGFKIVTTRKTNPYHVELLFESTHKLDLAIADYFSKKDSTHALAYAENYRSLRAMIQATRFGDDQENGGGYHD